MNQNQVSLGIFTINMNNAKKLADKLHHGPNVEGSVNVVNLTGEAKWMPEILEKSVY